MRHQRSAHPSRAEKPTARPARRALPWALLAGLLLLLAACAEDEGDTTADGADDATDEAAAEADDDEADDDEDDDEAEAAGDLDEVDLDVSVPDPADSAIGEAAAYFAEEIEARSDGQVTATVHPDGALFGGDQQAAIDQLGDGALDALMLSTSVYASVDSRMNAISLPYLFEDSEALDEYLSAEPGQELLEDLGDQDIEGLSMMIRTPRHVTNSVRPIEEPADFEGLTLRTPENPMWLDFFSAIGADPTPMSFDEVYTALELGTIDGQENPSEVPLANQFHEVQDYISMTGHIMDGWVFGLNQELYDGLGEDTQALIDEVAADTSDWMFDYSVEEEARIVAELEELGMESNELTDEGREELESAAQELYPEFADLVGDEEFLDTTLEFVGAD